MPNKQHIGDLEHLIGTNVDRIDVGCSILVAGVWKTVQGTLGRTEKGGISLIVGTGEETKEYNNRTRIGSVQPVH